MSCCECFPHSKGQVPKKRPIGDMVPVAEGPKDAAEQITETVVQTVTTFEVPPSTEPVLAEAGPEVTAPEPNEAEPEFVTTTSVQFASDEPNVDVRARRDTKLEANLLDPSREAEEAGMDVEYFSASNGGWIPAKLLGVDTVTGTCCLNVQPRADRQHVRGMKVGLGPLEVSVGTAVEYHSTSHGWIPALVQGFSTSLSEYVLNVQPRAAVDKVRFPLEPFPTDLIDLLGPEKVPKGLHVAYHSNSVGGWIPAEIQGFDEATNSYSLNVHPQAVAERIRFDLRGWRYEVVFADPGTQVPMRLVPPP
jgi:hypothetical protein